MFKDGKDYIPLTNGEVEECPQSIHNATSKVTLYTGSAEAQIQYDNAPTLGLVYNCSVVLFLASVISLQAPSYLTLMHWST